ncbi:MAG TPA: sulfite exporter TauE/SafE family protein [Fibrobacteraceae bacterium]|nr:sulfite exporter TauE/SafE family protein [Fibrobacteraceae bacterium]
MPQSILLFVAIGACAGVLSGLIGIGGGIVIVPALVLFAGFDQLAATGTSLAVLLMPIGIAAVLQYYKDGHVHVHAAITIALSFVLFAWFGALIAKKLPPLYLRLIFGVAVSGVGIYIAVGAWRKLF